MELAVHPVGDAVEVHATGRLDNEWSSYFADNLDQLLAGGARDLRIDLSDVNFISSAGIGVLVRYYNQLRSIQGSFVVVRTSARVGSVLKLVALDSVLCAARAPAPEPAVVPQRFETDAAEYDLYELAPDGALRCRYLGDPTPVFGSSFGAEACRPLPSCRFAIGLGALGDDFEECRDRFGEFIAVEGATAYQPTEHTSRPDYLVTDGGLADVQVLYGITCEGAFRQLVRFESRKDCGPLPLAELARQCLKLSGAESVGMVVVAEVAGIVGAALRRSPVGGEAVARFRHPVVGDWLSFSPERGLARTVALAAGICSAHGAGSRSPFLRPLTSAGDLLGHFHAAVFSYRPMQRGMLQLGDAVKHVFESQTLLSVLHLLNDMRPITGAGQSEFERGACWVAGLDEPAGVGA